MTIQRIKEYPYPHDFKGLPEANAWARKLHTTLTEEASERIEDFDILKLGNIGWEDARAWGVSIDSSDNQGALDAAFTDIQGTGKALFLPAGTYVTEKITAFTNSIYFYGSGILDTILQSKSGDTVIEVTGVSCSNLFFKGFAIDGNNTGSGHGIYIHDNNFPSYNLFFNWIRISDCGGKGLYIPDHFSSKFEGIDVDNCGDNAIEVNGGNTTTLMNCYVHDVAAGKCAYRIYSGRVTMISCNGVDSGETWGIFGQNAGEDGATTYAKVTLIGCNIEDFSSVGIRCKASSWLDLRGTVILAPATGTVKAFLFDFLTAGSQGAIDGTSSIGTKGAAWSDGKAIHTNGAGCPFISYNAGAVDFYRDDVTDTYTLPYLSTAYSSNLNYSLDVSRGYFDKVDFIVGNDFRDFTANDGTPSVADYNNFKTANTGATVITMFDDGVDGQMIKVLIADANTTIDFTGTNLKGNVGVDWTPASGDWLEAIFDGTSWFCSVHDCTA